MSWNRPKEARYGIHSINHFALDVPSLKEAHDFFTAFGLDVRKEAGGLALRTYGQPHVWAYLFESTGKRLAWLSLRCWADEFDALFNQALAAGATRVQAPTQAAQLPLQQAAWLKDGDGNLICLIAGDKTTLHTLEEAQAPIRQTNQRTVLQRSKTAPTQPQRLSHVLLFTPDINQAVAFYENTFGLRVSDRSEDAVVFMHARHGSDHHLLAFAKSHARGWHHSAWDVKGINDVGIGSEQMRKAGYTEGWGTGRHVLGSNFFHYVRDPWGSFAEYSAEIDFIPTGGHWDSGNYPPEDSMYLWGPDVPDYFLNNTDDLLD